MNFLRDYQAATRQPKYVGGLRFLILLLAGISLAVLCLGDIFKSLTDPNFTVFNMRAVESAVVVSAVMTFLYKQIEKWNLMTLSLALVASVLGTSYLLIREITLFKKIHQWFFRYEPRI